MRTMFVPTNRSTMSWECSSRAAFEEGTLGYKTQDCPGSRKDFPGFHLSTVHRL